MEKKKKRGAFMARKLIMVLVILTMVCTMAWADDGNCTKDTNDAAGIIQGILNSSTGNNNNQGILNSTAGNSNNQGILNIPGVNLNISEIVNALQGKTDPNGIFNSLQNTINPSTLINTLPGGSDILNSSGGGNNGQTLVNGIINSVFNQGNMNVPTEFQNMLNNGNVNGGQNIFRMRAAPGSR